MSLPPLRHIAAFVFFLLVSLFFYIGTVHSKFLYDWNSFMLHYIHEGWPGLANCYSETAMRWGYHFLNISMWELFGCNATGWFVVFISVHVLNAVLLLVLIEKLLGITTLQYKFQIAFAASLLWLVSPYHTEPVVWGAAILYLALTFLVLSGLLLFLKYTSGKNWRYIVGVYLCFYAAMFVFEAYVVFPFLLFALWLITEKTALNQLSIKVFLARFFAPMLLSIVAYFIANKLRAGSWVGHYGAASHLNTNLYLIIPNFSKYLLKLLYVPLFFDFKQRDWVYALLENHKAVKMAFVFYVVSFALLFYFFRKKSGTVKLTIGLFALYCFSLVPAINLYFMYYKDIEQDRYVYFASCFFYPALCVGLAGVFKKWSVLPLAICLLISGFYLKRNAYCWQQSGRIAESLTFDFRWQNASRVFVLLTPDSYNGAYCMRSMPVSSLSEMLEVQRGIKMKERIFELYQYNLTSPTDSVTYETIDSNKLKVRITNYGSWLWKNSFGASDFETELFKASLLNEEAGSYIVTFKNKQPGDVFIYPVNDHWKEVSNF